MKDHSSIKHILIDESVAEEIPVRNLLDRIDSTTVVEFVSDAGALMDDYRFARRYSAEKETLLVYKYRGRFLSPCPGSDGMVCCNYFVINTGVGCLFDCHYCYLQSYMNHPLMTLHGNQSDMFQEIREKTMNKNHVFRIGTGEYTDSLALEPLTGSAGELVRFFAGLDNAILELKTKSDCIESLLHLAHAGKTVISFSINPPGVLESVEDDTADLDARLRAAEKAYRVGYRLAFHLDPVIYFPDWEKEYHDLIDRLFAVIPADAVAWISLGSFRYSPGLKEMIQGRFPEDTLTRSEMVQGPDGKYRYFITIRREMYASIKEKIESVDPRLFFYLCMETRRMWDEVFDFVPHSAKILDQKFEERRQYQESLSAKSHVPG